MDVIYKGITTPNHFYVYDRSRNAILEVDKEEYTELEKIKTGMIKAENSSIVSKYQRNGFLKENTIRKIEHPCTRALPHYLRRHIEKLTLQVTQRCNLRCEYCIYSGNYDTRSHADFDMSFETAKKAIDLYLESSIEMSELTVAFYGGEPLLKYDLIKKCVDYIENKNIGRPVYFSMTTNGTLLNKSIVSYLATKNFLITISLDGSQEEHDKYRKFSNGKGSFSTICENLRAIKKDHPQIYNKITFNSVLNPYHNYQNIKNYFENDDLMASSEIFTNIVESTDLTEDTQFSSKFKSISKYDDFKLYLFMINKLDAEDVSKLVLVRRQFIYERYEQIIKKSEIGSTCHHSGPCIPGTRRLFVSVQGYMYPCERVSETSDVMSLGHLDTGFDLEKVEQILNIGKITENQCMKCWAILHCNQCVQKADGKNHLSKELKLKHCPNSKKEAYYQLKEICVLKECGCTFER